MALHCRRNWLAALLGMVLGALGVKAQQPPRAGYHPSHHCPRCGRLVLTVWRMNYPYPGRHGHRHGNTYWWH